MTDRSLKLKEIAELFELQFTKKSGADVQHLVPPEEKFTICNVGLGSDVNRSDRPGPFDPLCGNCERVLNQEYSPTDDTLACLRGELADMIDGVGEPAKQDDPARFDTTELAAIVAHIRALETGQ
jgi:hypothetical protein